MFILMLIFYDSVTKLLDIVPSHSTGLPWSLFLFPFSCEECFLLSNCTPKALPTEVEVLG